MNKLVDAYMDTLHAEGVIEPPYASPLDDPANALCDLDARCTMLEEKLATLEQLVQQQALNMLSMAQRLRDFTDREQSGIIRPHPFDLRGMS